MQWPVLRHSLIDVRKKGRHNASPQETPILSILSPSLYFLTSCSYLSTGVRLLFLNFSCCQLIMCQIKLLKTVSNISPTVKVCNGMKFVIEMSPKPGTHSVLCYSILIFLPAFFLLSGTSPCLLLINISRPIHATTGLWSLLRHSESH